MGMVIRPLIEVPNFLNRPSGEWRLERDARCRVDRMFRLWEAALRFMGACLGAELTQAGEAAFAAEWFRSELNLEGMHLQIRDAVRRLEAPFGAVIFPLAERVFRAPDVREHGEVIVEGWRKWRGGGIAAEALDAALAPRIEAMMKRWTGMDHLGLFVAHCETAGPAGLEWRGEAALPVGATPGPAVLTADHPAERGLVYLWDGSRPLAGLDPWVLHMKCPICGLGHFFLLEKPGDSSTRYQAMGAECRVLCPLDRLTLLRRAIRERPTAPEGGARQPSIGPEPPSISLGVRVERRLPRRSAAERVIIWSGDGRWLASGGADGAVRVDEYQSGEAMVQLKHHPKSVTALAWSPDDRHLVSGGAEGSIAVWNTTGWTKRTAITGAFLYPVAALAWSPSGVLLASAHAEPRVWLWDPSSWKTLGWLDAGEGEAACLAWTGPRFLASGGPDGRIRLWDAYRKRIEWTAPGHAQGVRALLASPDGRWLASAGGDGEIRLWSTGAGDLVLRLEAHRGGVEGISASREGGLLASRGGDGTVKVWDARAWKMVADLDGSHGPGAPIQFHPYLSLLAAAAPGEKRVQVYRLETDPPEERTDWGAGRSVAV